MQRRPLKNSETIKRTKYMKKIITLFCFLISMQTSFAQDKYTDSLISNIYTEKTDTGRIRRIYDIHNGIGAIDPGNVINYHQKMLDQSRKNKDKVGEAVILAELGYIIYYCGNTTQGTGLILDALKLAEGTGNQQAIGIAYNNLGICQPDKEKGKIYRLKALKASLEAKDYLFACWDMEGLSRLYGIEGKSDSAIDYAQRGYRLALEKQVTAVIPGCLQNMGDIQYRLGNKSLAMEHYLTALRSLDPARDQKTTGDIYFSIADFYNKEGVPDSAFKYAHLSFKLLERAFNSSKLSPSKLLWKLYQGRNSDSALKYSSIYYETRDSSYSIQKITQLGAMAMQEMERQQKNETERSRNLQYIGILIGLITFLTLFLMLSRSIIVSEKFISLFGVLGLLAMFEFINLFIHPYLAHITHESPILMLLILTGIAVLLVPLHHQLEKWTMKKIVEKNKAIRLAAAKRTIEKLENNQIN